MIDVRLNSLQSRIAIFHLMAMIVAAIVVPLTNYLVINRSANQFEAQSLRAHATTIGRYLHRDARGAWHLDLPDDLRTLYTHGLDGLSYQVIDGHGKALFASAPNSDAGVIPTSNNGLVHISHNGAALYGVTLSQAGTPTSIKIKVAQNVQHPDVIFDDIVADYLARIGWLTVTILAILLAVDIVAIRTALVPVRHASQIASAIDPGRTDLRLPTKDVPRELLPLILAVNEALGRLEKGILLQREFTADAAHELRTPLAVLQARIENFPDPNVMGAVRADLRVMESVINQLLDMAEIEGSTISTNGRCDLQAICADVVAMLADRAIGQGKEIALTGSEASVWIRGDSSMVFRAVRNLVDNAIRFTPEGTTVEVDVAPNGSVAVKDRGPGIPVEDRAFVFRRFWRAKRNSGEGAGLGLSIVLRIAEMHHAKVKISDHMGGGAIFSIRFCEPPSPPHHA
jgi:signal transduction histidine kinase